MRNLSVAGSPFAFSIIALSLTTGFGLPGVIAVALVFILTASILILLLYGYRTVPKIINPVAPLDRAFEHLYTAISQYDDAPNFNDPVVQQHVYNLLQSAYQNLEEPPAMMEVIEEAVELGDSTYDIIHYRLLPAAREGKISRQTVEKLTAILAAPTIDKLRAFNTEVTPAYEEKETGGIELGKRLSKMLRTKAGQLGSALGLGFAIIVTISVVYSVSVGIDVSTFFKDNPVLILGSGIALTVGLLAFFRN